MSERRYLASSPFSWSLMRTFRSVLWMDLMSWKVATTPWILSLTMMGTRLVETRVPPMVMSWSVSMVPLRRTDVMWVLGSTCPMGLPMNGA